MILKVLIIASVTAIIVYGTVHLDYRRALKGKKSLFWRRSK